MEYKIEAKPLGEYDVVVCGAGTAGCFAALSAAREGASVLLIERSFKVGGMLTTGNAGITKFTEHCRDVEKYKNEVIDKLGSDDTKKVQVVGGLAEKYVKALIENGDAVGTNGEAGSYVFTDKAAAQSLLVKWLDEAGVETLYNTTVCLANSENGNIKNIVIHNKGGFFEVYAKIFVDATGDGDVAYLAGAEFNIGATEQDLAEGCGTAVGQGIAPGMMYRVKGIDFPKLFEFIKNNREYFNLQRFGRMTLEECIERYEKGEMFVFQIKLNDFHCDYVPGKKLYDFCQVYSLPQKDEAIFMTGGEAVIGGFDVKNYRNGLDDRDNSKCQHGFTKAIERAVEAMRRMPGLENLKISYIPDIGIRETRHIVCEYMLTTDDVMTGRDFEDSIACGGHPLDGGKIPAELERFDFNHWRFHIPYRIMLPACVDNLLVTGRCVGATKGGWGAIRPTAQCMAMGEAAGIAAAISSDANVSPKLVDVKKLREKITASGGII